MAMTQGALLESVPKGLFIDGAWRDASDGATLPVDDPATGKILAHVASATVADGTGPMTADSGEAPKFDVGEGQTDVASNCDGGTGRGGCCPA